MDRAIVVVSIVSPYPHITAHDRIVWGMKAQKQHMYILYVEQYYCSDFIMTQKTNQVANKWHKAQLSFNVIKGAAILDCEHWVVEVPLIF